LLYADRHEEADICFWQFWRNRPQKEGKRLTRTAGKKQNNVGNTVHAFALITYQSRKARTKAVQRIVVSVVSFALDIFIKQTNVGSVTVLGV
jgi:hypothetical protein